MQAAWATPLAACVFIVNALKCTKERPVSGIMHALACHDGFRATIRPLRLQARPPGLGAKITPPPPDRRGRKGRADPCRGPRRGREYATKTAGCGCGARPQPKRSLRCRIAHVLVWWRCGCEDSSIMRRACRPTAAMGRRVAVAAAKAGPRSYAAGATRHLIILPTPVRPRAGAPASCIRAKGPHRRPAPPNSGRGVQADRAGPSRPFRRIFSRSSWSRFAAIADRLNTSLMCLSVALRPLAVSR